MLHTPLHGFHIEHKAKMVDFAGWDMPMFYSGIHEEHKQVRTSGGLFDVSHMGRVKITGRHARKLLERLCTRRISDMTAGQCRYSLCCNETGGVHDDVIVYRMDEDDFLVVVNGANREKMLASVTPALESESVMERFEKIVRTVPEPSEAAARAYYDKHKDLFVEPEQVKMSVILFKVDPSSRQEVWNGAHAEAKAVHQKLVAGADFGELARLHSGDRSAARGGEMEYVHRGMLPEALHGAVDKMVPGNISEPVQLLEGVAILRLDGRRPAAQRAFDQVKARAAELWKRAEADARWAALIADLRRNTKIRIDESQYGPLRGAAEKARTG